DPARQKKYGDVLPALRALQAESNQTRQRDAALASFISSSSYLGSAESLYRLSQARPKPDLEREPGLQERDWPRLREAQDRMQRTMDAAVDQALMRWALAMVAALPADQRIPPIDQAAGLKPGMPKAESDQAIDQFLKSLFADTKLGNRDFRMSPLEKSTAELMAT